MARRSRLHAPPRRLVAASLFLSCLLFHRLHPLGFRRTCPTVLSGRFSPSTVSSPTPGPRSARRSTTRSSTTMRRSWPTARSFRPSSSSAPDGADLLSDGFHRLLAYRKAGRSEIEAEVHEGTSEAALWFALGVNRAHGHRLYGADKRHAVQLAYRAWPDLSQVRIAAHVGCTRQYVGKVRAQLETSFMLLDRVVGRDGRSRPATRPASSSRADLAPSSSASAASPSAAVSAPFPAASSSVAGSSAVPDPVRQVDSGSLPGVDSSVARPDDSASESPRAPGVESSASAASPSDSPSPAGERLRGPGACSVPGRTFLLRVPVGPSE